MAGEREALPRETPEPWEDLGHEPRPRLVKERGSATATKPQQHADMVRWLHPTQVLRTGLDAVVSAVFGARADPRLIEAVVRPQVPFFDYSNETLPDGDFWLDYVSDVGDGWDSTYTVARLLALPELKLPEAGGARVHDTQRGRVLVFGGDAVYPGASREMYEERTVQPYEAAMRRSQAPRQPDLFVIPGNHDWYDGLSAFMRLFCANRWLAGRRTRQSRSYFALKLPQRWWLVGTDVQLNHDIDVPQVEYFRQVAQHMEPEDRIILCNAEPAWIMAAAKRKGTWMENNLEYLQEKVLGRRISVFLAGDLHHYRRHEDATGRQKITAGGGGAFLHPTHAPAAPVLRDGYQLRKSYPDEKTSRRLARKNLLLIRYSPLFGLMTGALYLLLALAAYAEVGSLGLSQLPEVLAAVGNSMVNRPWTLTLGLVTVGGLMGLADTALGRWRALAGALHGFGHIATAFAVAWASTYFTVSKLGVCPVLTPDGTHCADGWLHLAGKFLLSCGFTFLGGFLVGPFVVGLYLWLSVNFFGAHSNEAFGSLALPDWKNFLRMRIGADGKLTVYPVGIERVARKWKPTGAGPHAPAFDPDDPKATEPVLIEPPLRL